MFAMKEQCPPLLLSLVCFCSLIGVVAGMWQAKRGETQKEHRLSYTKLNIKGIVCIFLFLFFLTYHIRHILGVLSVHPIHQCFGF